jgi:hypothetical protein
VGRFKVVVGEGDDASRRDELSVYGSNVEV